MKFVWQVGLGFPPPPPHTHTLWFNGIYVIDIIWRFVILNMKVIFISDQYLDN